MAKKIYQQIMVVSIIAFIPITLAAGLAAGYIVGSFLKEQFRLPEFVFVVCLVVGVAGSIIEVVKLIRLAIRTEKYNHHD